MGGRLEGRRGLQLDTSFDVERGSLPACIVWPDLNGV